MAESIYSAHSTEMLEILSRLFSESQAVQLRHEQIQRQTAVPVTADL